MKITRDHLHKIVRIDYNQRAFKEMYPNGFSSIFEPCEPYMGTNNTLVRFRFRKDVRKIVGTYPKIVNRMRREKEKAQKIIDRH